MTYISKVLYFIKNMPNFAKRFEKDQHQFLIKSQICTFQKKFSTWISNIERTLMITHQQIVSFEGVSSGGQVIRPQIFITEI